MRERERALLVRAIMRHSENESERASAIKARLAALSGPGPVEGAEEDFKTRLASLVSAETKEPSSADLSARLARLSTATTTKTQIPTYEVPEV